MGHNSDGRRNLGPRRRCQRRHQHVCGYGQHIQHGRQLDGRRSDYPFASWADLHWSPDLTIGCQQTGSRSTTPIPIWAVSARQWSMCLELRLRSLCLLLAKIRMLIWLIATISAGSLHLWPRLMSLELTEEHQLSHITPARERILAFIMTPARSGPTKLRQQIHPP